MEELLGLAIFGSFVWFNIILGILLISFFAAEHQKNGYIATFFLVTFLTLNYFFGNVPIMTFVSWGNILGYLGAGLVYSLVRAFFFGRKEAAGFKTRGYGKRTDALNSIKEELQGNSLRWLLLWPISLIWWFLSDLIREVWDWIYQKCGAIFGAMLELGFNSKLGKEPVEITKK